MLRYLTTANYPAHYPKYITSMRQKGVYHLSVEAQKRKNTALSFYAEGFLLVYKMV